MRPSQMRAVVLASSPPGEALIGRIVAGAIAAVAAWIAAAHEIGWLAILCGLVASVALYGVGRILWRWRVAHASIVVADRALVLRLPRRRWGIFERVDTLTVPLAELRALRFETGADSRLLVVSSTTTIEVPSGLFTICPRELDANVRRHAPHGGFADPLAEIEPIASWTASGALRAIGVVFCVSVLAGPLVAQW